MSRLGLKRPSNFLVVFSWEALLCDPERSIACEVFANLVLECAVMIACMFETCGPVSRLAAVAKVGVATGVGVITQ